MVRRLEAARSGSEVKARFRILRVVAICRLFGKNFKVGQSSGGANSIVEAKNGKVWNCGSANDCAGQMNGVQGPDRLGGERLASQGDDFRINAQYVPSCRCDLQALSAVIRFVFRYLFKRHTAKKHPLTFNQGELGRHDQFRVAQQPPYDIPTIFAEEP